MKQGRCQTIRTDRRWRKVAQTSWLHASIGARRAPRSARSGEAAAAAGRRARGAARHRSTGSRAGNAAGKGGELFGDVARPARWAGHTGPIRAHALEHLETSAALTAGVFVEGHQCSPQPVQREPQSSVGTPSGKTSSVEWIDPQLRHRQSSAPHVGTGLSSLPHPGQSAACCFSCTCSITDLPYLDVRSWPGAAAAPSVGWEGVQPP